MLFNSFSYVLFLPVVFAVYWLLPHRFRWMLMLAASYYFYMSWNAKYVWLILFTTVVSYAAALLMEKQEDKRIRKIILAAAAVMCLGVLFCFKYFNFAGEAFAGLLSLVSVRINPPTLKLLLPVGISFYTFQTLSYTIDVYRGDVKAEHHFGYYATFVSFFPQLVAGPIERTENLLPQIKARHEFDYEQATYGLKLMAWGYFKKIVVADGLSQYVSAVYGAPQGIEGFALLLATLFFTIQIYCDFSGYSDIAIGTAKLMGINLMTNFKSPYLSGSIRQFWSRWHISLSTWFRDYVYIPLGGNRAGKGRRAFNILVTFLLSGLWHGADWTFVIWGGLHGLAQIVENSFPGKEAESGCVIKRCVKVIGVFIFVAFAWIFFVSGSLQDAVYVTGHLFRGISHPVLYVRHGLQDIGMSPEALHELIPSLLLLFAFDLASLRKDVIQAISDSKGIIRWGVYIVFALWIVFAHAVVGTSEFIYFRF